MEPSNPYASPYSVAQSPENVRTEFFQKTYLHLAGAIGAFVILEAALFRIPGIDDTVFGMLQGRFSWLVVLGLFMGASWLANKWATSDTSRGMQYAGLSLYIVAEAIIFLPLLLIASRTSMLTGSNLIGQAGLITLGLFAGLTFVAFTTKKDFSFLGGMLKIGAFVAIGLIVASIFMGFNLGIWFSGAMVLFAGGSILYQTSNIIHHYRSDQYVAASLGLFASVALLFWYILRILMSLRSGD
ncbi:MAG: FtsH-binding integral membrane protein [Paracoccaceae bacterium]|jgi:FtsH-binding integral membrane protein